jgi:hypothetical protein
MVILHAIVKSGVHETATLALDGGEADDLEPTQFPAADPRLTRSA